ncbi:MAG: phosphoenolpyruvate carboxykinase (ATP) [Flavobacteriales bacterium]|nr:phosphoenolpyruvate carboxykinase (ATP) [Bacteroidota bacterium]MCB9241097.1 phosphoenolpyruvate carboxykinase (ATP) [Flavobacteriales bacterium]
MKNNPIIEKVMANASEAFLNLSVDELIEHALNNKEGELTSTGALAADTGEFTGRSPKDKFVVRDATTENTVWWGSVNQPFEREKFDALLAKVIKHYEGKRIYVRDAYACADENYRMNIGVVTESAYQNLFANNLFLRPTAEEAANQQPEWIILAAPSFNADAAVDGTRQHNFTIVDFTNKIILIGGSGYTGELKKGIFSVLNYTLPENEGVLSMHCSANIGEQGDTAIFFGLSGTGKTTLSADPDRKLIGDDEHGWSGNTVFNFEGGCYAKCIDLTEEKEPQIWKAIKRGALVENVRFFPNSNEVDYTNTTVTENTRVAYPIDHIDNIAVPSVGTAPKNIFFLTADAFGVLPPISKLNPGQAGYHFISGYTAKVAGTEAGIVDPVATFSACFGQAFLPLHPAKYAEMLGEKMRESNVNVWLVNTGWSGGPFGIGKRMSLKNTRAMITAALNGELDQVEYTQHPVFGLQMPTTCPNVPSEVLNPRNTWSDKSAYDEKANHLAGLFNDNFSKFEAGANEEIKAAAPKALRTS